MSGWSGVLGLGGGRRPRPTAAVSGYLWKMKRTPRVLTPQWTRRFFVLEGRRLRWFESEAAEEERGSVDLRTLTGVSRYSSHWPWHRAITLAL